MHIQIGANVPSISAAQEENVRVELSDVAKSCPVLPGNLLRWRYRITHTVRVQDIVRDFGHRFDVQDVEIDESYLRAVITAVARVFVRAEGEALAEDICIHDIERSVAGADDSGRAL